MQPKDARQRFKGQGIIYLSINVTQGRPNLQLRLTPSTSELQPIFKCEAYIFLKYGVSVCNELVVEGRDTQEAFTKQQG